jgi:hypothetical protein
VCEIEPLSYYEDLLVFRNDDKGLDDGTTQTKSSLLKKSTLDRVTKSDLTKTTPFSTGYRVSSRPEIHSLHPAEAELVSTAEGENYVDNYSDAGSIADHEEMYANILSNELLQDLKEIGGENIEQMLCTALEEFAVRLGHQGESRNHQNMMYIAHKNRR